MSRSRLAGLLLVLAIASAFAIASAPFASAGSAGKAEIIRIAAASDHGGAPGAGRSDDSERARLAHERAQQAASLAAERSRSRGRDYEFNAVRTAVLVVGICVFVWGLWLRGRDAKRQARLQRAALLLIALAAFGAYYQFFTVVRNGGFRTPDNFHYYVGSKYFDALGYYRLYDCSLTVLNERGGRPIRADQPVRDLHTMETGTAAEALERGRDCASHFSPERWREFGNDVDWFTRLWPPHIWKAIWDDHGYHPTPIWTVIGGDIAELLPTDDADAMHMLAHADRFIVALGLLAIGWAFGLEAACLAALIFGTGHLWRYTFVGDAYFRYLWWISAVLGVCFLRRAWPSLAGASLAASALLRIFPGALAVAFLVRTATLGVRTRRWTPEGVRFVAGAALAGVLLIGWALATESVGASAFVDFAAKIGAFTKVPASNKVGLDVATMWIFGVDATASRVAAWLLRGVFLLLFWRGLRDADGAEAAAFGWTLIPILSEPTSYYYSFVALGAVLAIRRPRIAVILLLCCLAWNVNGLLNYREYIEYWYASLVAVLCVGAIAFEMGRPAPAPDALPEPAAQD